MIAKSNNPQNRAMDEAGKQERASAILDAAEALLEQNTERLPNVIEVAKAAGLAKGTVYLYFNSKEQLLLALHARHTETFFAELHSYLTKVDAASIEDILQITWGKIVQPKSFLPLASQCLGAMDKALSEDDKRAFHERVIQLLQASGALLEKHYSALEPGQGASLLMRSYAVIVGLWQLMQPEKSCISNSQLSDLSPIGGDYSVELENTLRALWQGHIHPYSANDSEKIK